MINIQMTYFELGQFVCFFLIGTFIAAFTRGVIKALRKER